MSDIDSNVYFDLQLREKLVRDMFPYAPDLDELVRVSRTSGLLIDDQGKYLDSKWESAEIDTSTLAILRCRYEYTPAYLARLLEDRTASLVKLAEYRYLVSDEQTAHLRAARMLRLLRSALPAIWRIESKYREYLTEVGYGESTIRRDEAEVAVRVSVCLSANAFAANQVVADYMGFESYVDYVDYVAQFPSAV